MNVIETLLNVLYLWLLNQQNVSVGVANFVGFSAALMTLSKTVLYWLVEPFSGYQHIGHNSTKDLVLLWIVSILIEFKRHVEELTRALFNY
jgi:hypothetical protein